MLRVDLSAFANFFDLLLLADLLRQDIRDCWEFDLNALLTLFLAEGVPRNRFLAEDFLDLSWLIC